MDTDALKMVVVDALMLSKSKGWKKAHHYAGVFSAEVQMSKSPSLTVWLNTPQANGEPWYTIVVNLRYDVSSGSWKGEGTNDVKDLLAEVALVYNLMYI